MDGVEKVQIEKLEIDESNWPQWQFVVRTILDCNGALEVCEGTLVKPEPPGSTSEQTQKAYQETLKKFIYLFINCTTTGQAQLELKINNNFTIKLN
ncbi:hypothetical protein FQR65_LT05534 [Abscondita terminalis]|nr:hypothetical protein FQR65_LT05534 [Abscondita terminalis]